MQQLQSRLITLISWALLLSNQWCKAQSLPNFDFNDWAIRSQQTLENWKFQGRISRDSLSAQNLGVTLHNDSSGFTSLYRVGNKFPDKYNGGFSINGTPTSIKISFRSDALLNDTGLVIFGCTKTGDSLPIILQQIYVYPGQGNSTTHATINTTLNYAHPIPSLVADSAFIVVYSSLRSKTPNGFGSLTISDIQLSSTSVFPDNGNLGIDQWQTLSVEYPQQWYTSHNSFINNQDINSTSLQLTSKYSAGAETSLELKSQIVAVNQSSDTLAAWAITTSAINFPPNITKPTFPYTSKPGAIKIDWTGFIDNGDRFTATINFFRGDSVIGSGTFSKSAFNLNQNISMPSIENIEWLPNYPEMPEYATVKLWLTDSNFAKQSTTPSFVRISKISLLPFGLNTQKQKINTWQLYPNPASTHVIINTSESPDFVQLINYQGNIIYTWHSPASNRILIPTHISAGNYWLTIGSKSQTSSKPLQIIR